MSCKPLATYFVIVYAASAVALAVLSRDPALSLALFPELIVSVAVAGLALTASGGPASLLDLWGRLRRWRISPRWYLLLLVPPAAIIATLTALRVTVSPAFLPGWLWFGIPIGMAAGFLEEIGWTGFAYPRMRARLGAAAGALLLGVLWGVWHLPVVDSLGAASPHGQAWPAFFAAFVAVLAAIRCIICWAYDRTQSVLIAQLIHASSTGSLVLLSAPRVGTWQEAQWYAAYAGLLWLVILAAVLLRSEVRRATA